MHGDGVAKLHVSVFVAVQSARAARSASTGRETTLTTAPRAYGRWLPCCSHRKRSGRLSQEAVERRGEWERQMHVERPKDAPRAPGVRA